VHNVNFKLIQDHPTPLPSIPVIPVLLRQVGSGHLVVFRRSPFHIYCTDSNTEYFPYIVSDPYSRYNAISSTFLRGLIRESIPKKLEIYHSVIGDDFVKLNLLYYPLLLVKLTHSGITAKLPNSISKSKFRRLSADHHIPVTISGNLIFVLILSIIYTSLAPSIWFCITFWLTESFQTAVPVVIVKSVTNLHQTVSLIHLCDRCFMGVKSPMIDLVLVICFGTNWRDCDSRVHMKLGGGYGHKIKQLRTNLINKSSVWFSGGLWFIFWCRSRVRNPLLLFL